jgi:nucleoside-diphosphate-sugar epimerase
MWTVIGGTGFLGAGLIEALRRAGRSVCVVSRRAPKCRHPGTEYRVADVSDKASISKAVSGSEVVYQLTTTTSNDPYSLQQDIVCGTSNVLEAVKGARVSRYIFVSSIAALNLRKSESLPVTADPKPLLRNYYARYKIQAERAVLEACHYRALPAVIVRPGIVVGPGRSVCHDGLGHWVSDLCCIGFGHGRNPLPFVLNEDVATALELTGHARAVEGFEFNLAGDVKMSATEFLAYAAAYSGRRFRFYPQGILRGQMQDLARWSLKAVSRKPWNRFPRLYDRKSMMCLAYVNSELAKATLGWRPNSSVEYFLEQAVHANLNAIKVRHSLSL